MSKWYKDFFKIHEIENSKTLQYFFYALLIGFFYGFQELYFRNVGIVSRPGFNQDFVCPEYFQSCSSLFIFPSRFESWAYSIFHTIQFALLLGAAYFAFHKDWVKAHFLIIFPFFTKLFFNIFLSGQSSIPFEMDHLLPCLFWLFGQKKEQNLKFLIILLYVFSGLVKLDGGWIAGTYFSSTILGLPFVSDGLISLMTNFVIFMELFLVWFLFSNHFKIRSSIFWILFSFHLYSCLFVGYRYPLQFLPFVFILFKSESPISKPSSFGVSIFLLMGLANFWPHFVPGDHKLTFEGRALALDMFDGNRQTHSTEKIFYLNGETKEQNTSGKYSVERISPYSVFFKLKEQCRDPQIQKIEWKMNISLNGSPFYVIVNQENACVLSYKAFMHNPWISLDPKISGYPEKNLYYGADGLRSIPRIYPEKVYSFNSLTLFLERNTPWISLFYLVIALFAPIAARRRFF